VRSSQGRVGGGNGVLLASSGPDHQRFAGQHGLHPPKLLDQVGVRFAVNGGLDVPRMRARMERDLLLAVNNHVTRLNSAQHSPLLAFPISIMRLAGSRAFFKTRNLAAVVD
jgi:hypothetical protein